jgi:hypothetical protein
MKLPVLEKMVVLNSKEVFEQQDKYDKFIRVLDASEIGGILLSLTSKRDINTFLENVLREKGINPEMYHSIYFKSFKKLLLDYIRKHY